MGKERLPRHTPSPQPLPTQVLTTAARAAAAAGPSSSAALIAAAAAAAAAQRSALDDATAPARARIMEALVPHIAAGIVAVCTAEPPADNPVLALARYLLNAAKEGRG